MALGAWKDILSKVDCKHFGKRMLQVQRLFPSYKHVFFIQEVGHKVSEQNQKALGKFRSDCYP